LLEAAADAADRLGTREDQRELLEKLAQLDIDPSADPESAGRVYLLHGRYAVATGQYGLARGLYKNAVDLLERAGAQLEHSEALRRLSAVQSHVGNLVDARGLAERARDRAVVAPQRALALLQLATVGVLEDRLEASLEQTEEALRLLRSDTTWSLPGALAGAHLVRSRVYKSAGDIARALAAARQALDLARAAGERRLLCETTARLGWLMLDIDRPEEAQALLREAQLLAREIEDRRGEALSTLFLGILLWEVDDPEALLTIESAEQMAADLGLARVAQLAIALRARIEHASGNHAQALETSERAIHSMERHGAEWTDRVVIVGTHAMCLRSADRPKPAKEAERALRRQLDRENKALVSPALRDRHRRRSEALIAAVISPEGPVYPRVHLP
jgi:tetratricopeptide (TPR) repeat protein